MSPNKLTPSSIFGTILLFGMRTVVILTAIFLALQVYLLNQHCVLPIRYKIGTIDQRFGVTKVAFENDIKQAGDIWSIAIGRTLFTYDPKGPLAINLVYDVRQEKTQESNLLSSNIKTTKQVADSVKTEYSTLEDDYRTANQTYETQVAEYNDAAAQYEEQVSYWNARGGAPEGAYLTLVSEKSDLNSRKIALEQERQAVNGLASQINTMIDKYNLLVSHIATDVNAINNNGLTGKQFEEGVYVSDGDGKYIDIYQFDNQVYFIRVLAHELGHALGLDHNNNPKSIMSPVNQVMSLKMSSEDLSALKAECGVK